MKTRIFLIFIFLFSLIISYSQDNSSDLPKDLPKAPEGFTWKSLSEIKAYFLIPNGWYFNYEKNKNTHAYFITKEDYKTTPTNQYITGISINVVTKIKNINVKKYLKDFIKKLKQITKVINESNEINFGPFSQYNLQYISYSKELNKNIKIHEVLIANSKTNCLYFIMFETPEELWDINWPKVEAFFQYIAIDDTI